MVGWPVAHSRSPLIHGHWLEKLGIEGRYEKVAVEPAGIEAFFSALGDRDSPYAGGNVTIPHKEAAWRLVDRHDETADLIGAANTLYRKDGIMRAANTDAYGFAANLDDRAPGWDAGRTAVVHGAGGASRAVIFALMERGFTDIRIVNRTIGRAVELRDRFGARTTAHELEEAADLLEKADLFVNTTSLGMDGTNVPILDFSVMAEGAIVTDIVYTPLMTPFLIRAAAQGVRIADGLGMLLHQAVPGFEHWFGARPEVTPELRALIVAGMEVPA